MNKLLQLLEWVTVPQAAKHLSVLVGEEVSEADVLQLALHRKITLSVDFVNHAIARHGKTIPLSNAETEPGIPVEGVDLYNVVLGLVLPDREQVLTFDDAVVSVSGVWDLPMIGSESLDVAHKFQQLTGGPEVTLQHIDGTFIQRGDDLCQLQAHFEDNEHFAKERLKTPWSHPANFYPAGGLPADAVFVVRTAELTRFQAALSEGNGSQRSAAACPSPRSETTYLTIIGAILELELGKTPAGKPQSVFESQAAIIDALEAHYHPRVPGISKTTLENRFAEARRRLHST